MTMLDVSIALSNPYTLDYFTVIRRAESATASGELNLTTVQFNLIPGVVSAPESGLDRQPDFDVQPKRQEVVTLFFLRGETLDNVAQAYKPDVVQWKGNNYLVKNVKDYSNFGAGFVLAEIALTDIAAQPPQVIVSSPPLAFGKMQIFSFTGPGPFNLPVTPSDPTKVAAFFDGVLQANTTQKILWTLVGNVFNWTFNVGAQDATTILL